MHNLCTWNLPPKNKILDVEVRERYIYKSLSPRTMRQPFIILLLWLLITPFATSNYTVQMTVILASMDVSAFAPLQLAFRRAIASTAQVDISAVSVNSYSNHVTSSSFRRLLSFRHLLSTSTEVSFFIQATDYQTASAIGIRLKPV